MGFEFKIMRSLIYVGLAKEEYRPKLMDWLYRHHIPDSISTFGPYCTKYAFYQAYPTPNEGERFGVRKMQLTEHYWLVDEHMPEMANRIMTEYMPMDVLRWQGCIPDVENKRVHENAESGDAGRAVGGDNGCPPFIFAFVPINWEEDFRGKGRTVQDGPNYRWQFMIKYPDGISKEEGEKWFYDEVVPYFTNCCYVNRFVSSKIMINYGATAFDRVSELWFEGEEEWYKAVVEETKSFIKKPEWAQEEEFPYLKPQFNIASVFLGDIATMDAYSQYRGYIPMR
ncbi:alpha-glucosidase, family 31 of glycosyl hydrolase [Clostridioides difficile]|nr:hypothetical protein [Clostridioides difficile]AXU48271.1 alpha-glucosidase, family 31 of glycosyl hydrolase [Clostridioides difficile]AXU51847.1 alpha-glucosidase, family 31 of glycosyl hydrolase [Clostridioides difficile]AXU66405.1 alpha-glucosidase, family 31 of glycosyl hydrolase [Clostridioides difficile]AXU77439.1 alpha-glucosidase, family 31 of glycosyl hydrolase [Clostridioides difficile]EQF44260.1 hypothetical protein QG7_3687 [Clostridioides difficile CD175]